MKHAIFMAAAAFAMLPACTQQSPADANAAAMVDAADRQADQIEAAADASADALKNQADQLQMQAENAGGYTGERLKTRADALDREADIIEDQGEARADAIEGAAKAEADASGRGEDDLTAPLSQNVGYQEAGSSVKINAIIRQPLAVFMTRARSVQIPPVGDLNDHRATPISPRRSVMRSTSTTALPLELRFRSM